MQCPEFEDRLNVLLDERRNPDADPRLVAHTQVCWSCRQLLAGQQALFIGLGRSAVPALPANFSRRVVTAMRSEPSALRVSPTEPSSKIVFRRRIWLASSVLLTSAAASLIAVSLISSANRDKSAAIARKATVASTKGTDSGSPKLAAGQQRGSRTRRGVPGGLALAQSSWIVESPRLHEHMPDYDEALDTINAALPNATKRLDQMEQVAPGLRPIRRSFFLLWDTLCRALPRARQDVPETKQPGASLLPAIRTHLA